MRIGITTDGDMVSAHFGQCSAFTIVEIENSEIKTKEVVPNNAIHGGGGCVAVDEMLKNNITHVIAGGMGMGAQQKFASAGVTISSYNGTVDDAIAEFINDKTYELSACKEHGDCH
ncbi:MAG: NifB/NifX family molybdenum-iron cluster-binding protein [Candidatus Margulisiibacteriota bacterium]